MGPCPTAPVLLVGLSLGDGEIVGQEEPWARWGCMWAVPGQLRVPLVCLQLKLDPKDNLQRLFLRACGHAVKLAVIQTEHVSKVPRSYINFMVVFRRV